MLSLKILQLALRQTNPNWILLSVWRESQRDLAQR